MNNTITSKIIYLDFFSIPLTLNVFGKKKHRSLLGAFISLSSMVFFAFAFQKKLQEFIDYKTINVKQSAIQKTMPPNISITNSNLIFAMRFDIWNDDTLQTDTSSLPFAFKISANSQIMQKQEEKIKLIKSSINIPVVPCTTDHFRQQSQQTSESIESSFSLIGIEQYSCPQLDAEYILGGDQNSSNFNYLKIDIVSCLGSSNCWTQEQIDDYVFKNQYFKVQIIFNSYIPNYDDPIYLKPIIYNKKFFKFIPSKMKPITEFFFAQNNIDSDESWFWFSPYHKEIFVMHSEEEFRENIMIPSQESFSYGEFIFKRSSFTYTTIRDYEKIDSILSYMGGFIQMVLFGASFIMGYYNSQNLKLKLANELYRFEEQSQLSSEDKDISKYSTRQDYLENIFEQVSKKPKNLSLSPSYFLFCLTFDKFFKTPENLLIKEAIKDVKSSLQNQMINFQQVDKDLNMFEILLRLYEIDKLKQIMFSEDQRKILEYAEKPQINLETIQKNSMIENIKLKYEKRKMKREKQQRARKQLLGRKGIFSKIQMFKSSSQLKKSFTSEEKNSEMNYEIVKKGIKQEQLIQEYVNYEKNMIRVKKISRLLVEDCQINEDQKFHLTPQLNQQENNNQINNHNNNIHHNKHKGDDLSITFFEEQKTKMRNPMHYKNQSIQQSNGFEIYSYYSPLIQQECIPCYDQQNHQTEMGDKSTPQISTNDQNNHKYTKPNYQKHSYKEIIQAFEEEEKSPLKQFLRSTTTKKNNNQGMLLNLIKELRPQTFYSERTDYSNFASFYDLYQICEESILKQNPQQQVMTKQIINFLSHDIKEVFSLANLLPKKEDQEKQLKIQFTVKEFIKNLKVRTIKLSKRKQSDQKNEKEENNQLLAPEKLNMNEVKLNQINFSKEDNQKNILLSSDSDNIFDLNNARTDQKNSSSILYQSNNLEQKPSDLSDLLILGKSSTPNQFKNSSNVQNNERKNQNDLIQNIYKASPSFSVIQMENSIEKNPKNYILNANFLSQQNKGYQQNDQTTSNMNQKFSISDNQFGQQIDSQREADDTFMISKSQKSTKNQYQQEVMDPQNIKIIKIENYDDQLIEASQVIVLDINNIQNPLLLENKMDKEKKI